MRLTHIPRRFFQLLIRLYQKTLSPIVGQQCRFYPTCSCYAHTAFEKHGAIKGIILTIIRLMKCHPWIKCNWNDPVPDEFMGRGKSDKKTGINAG